MRVFGGSLARAWRRDSFLDAISCTVSEVKRLGNSYTRQLAMASETTLSMKVRSAFYLVSV